MHKKAALMTHTGLVCGGDHRNCAVNNFQLPSLLPLVPSSHFWTPSNLPQPTSVPIGIGHPRTAWRLHPVESLGHTTPISVVQGMILQLWSTSPRSKSMTFEPS